MAGADVSDRPPQCTQGGAQFRDVLAHLGGAFDLRTRRLGRYLAAEYLFALTKQWLRWLDRQSAGLFIDQQVLLFNAEGELGFVTSHCLPLVRRLSLMPESAVARP